MPQPDNKREYGSTTRGSQRTVAPQGQMAADISPVSGGAASAAPVLQIGQQAQIKQTGAELFQALSGAFQGISQGIKTYEQMYSLVSERDFAEFETAYVQESDRVKGDPTKLKTWMDSSSYKPNRVTAKRFHTMRAEVNGRAYDEDQNDQWMDMQRHMATMTQTEALDYMNEQMPQYDEASPIYKQMETSRIAIEGNVAASTRQTQMSVLETSFKSQNTQLLNSLHSKGFADLSDPSFKVIMSARNLGLVQVDAETGAITSDLFGDQVLDPNSITPDVMATLQTAIGDHVATQGGDYVGAALAASELPLSMLKAGRASTRSSVDDVSNKARVAAESNDPTVIRTLIGNLPTAEDGNPTGAVPGLASRTLDKLVHHHGDNPEAFLAALITLETSLDWEASEAMLVKQGYNEESYALAMSDVKKSLEDSRNKAVVGITGNVLANLDAQLDTAVTPAELEQLSRRTFVNLADTLAETGMKTRVLVGDPTKDGFYVPGAVEDLSELKDLPPGIIPLGVEIINPDINSKVPFLTARMDDTSGFVFEGSGSDRVPKQVTEALAGLEKDRQEIEFSRRLMDNDKANQLSPTQAQAGLSRIARRSPQMALGVMASSPVLLDLFPGDTKEGQALVAFARASVQDPNTSQRDRQIVNEAFASSKTMQLAAGDSPTDRILFQMSGMAPKGTKNLLKWAESVRLGMESPQFTIPKAQGADLIADLQSGATTELAALETLLSKDNSELTLDQRAKVNLMQGLIASFAENRGGEDFLTNLRSPNAAISLDAQEYARKQIEMNTRIEGLLAQGLVDKNTIPALQRNGNITPSMTPQDPNSLSAPVGNLTAPEQAAIAVLSWLGADRDESIARGLFKGFGVEDFEAFKKAPHKFPEVMELMSTVKMIPMGLNTTPQKDAEGRTYTPFTYRLDLSAFAEANENIAKQVGISDPQNVTIERHFYRNGDGGMTGDQILRMEEEAKTSPRTPTSGTLGNLKSIFGLN